MKFKSVALEDAEGSILGHNLTTADGRRAFRKGRALDAADLAELAALGRRTVWVARLEEGDVGENAAAERIVRAIMGEGLRRSRASAGRVNLRAESPGVVRLELERLRSLNRLPGVTLATLPRHVAVSSGKTVATLKILPYALPEEVVRQAEELAAAAVISVATLRPTRAGLILSGSPGARDRIVDGFRDALARRLGAWRCEIAEVAFVPFDGDDAEARLTAALAEQLESGHDLILFAGETAIMDAEDVAPRAVAGVGGMVEAFGAPVDPGNLLMLAYRDATPIVGAPGCARSPKTNVVDLVLPRLLVGDRLDAVDLAELGHGGLLEDVPERPLPRSRAG